MINRAFQLFGIVAYGVNLTADTDVCVVVFDIACGCAAVQPTAFPILLLHAPVFFGQAAQVVAVSVGGQGQQDEQEEAGFVHSFSFGLVCGGQISDEAGLRRRGSGRLKRCDFEYCFVF